MSCPNGQDVGRSRARAVNAGSSAQGKSLALPNVINFFEGGCFLAEDPLLGTDGRGASPWIPFANGLAPGHDHVIVAPFTVGDSSIRRWDGDIGAQLARTLKTIASKYRVTHFLWQQGESDGEMSAGEYATHLRKVIALTRSAFPASSFHVAIASRCGNSPADNGVRAGQSAVIDPKAGIFQGPDTDVIIERYDACHFSDSGRLEAARLWLKAIIQPNG